MHAAASHDIEIARKHQVQERPTVSAVFQDADSSSSKATFRVAFVCLVGLRVMNGRVILCERIPTYLSRAVLIRGSRRKHAVR